MSSKKQCGALKINPTVTLLLWDSDALPTKGNWITVLWRSYGVENVSEIISIPTIVEKQADALRSRYLAWVYALGETRIDGKRLVDHLELRPGFSAWWMSLFAEKSNNFKSPQITDAIRLMAFESWTIGRPVGRVVLVSANQTLVKCMRSWCAKLGVAFEWRRVSNEAESVSWTKHLYQSLPRFIQTIAWLAHYLVNCWPLRGVGLCEWRKTEGRKTFVSYLFNLAPDAAKEGRFESRYWGHLPDDLQSEGYKTNWLHLYVKDASLPTAGAADLIRQFNKTGHGGQIHATLETFIGAKVVIRTLLDWGRLAWMGMNLHQAFPLPEGSALDLWPLFKEDWNQFISGPTGMCNVLTLNLFEVALKSLPEQRVGIYLQENQGWEFALIHAWKAAGHDRLVGSPHSTVRYWDLRYFFDPRSYCRNGGNNLPLPDQVALNGAAATNAYQQGGYPAEDLVEVEALRYLYLLNVGVRDTSNLPFAKRYLRVLVLGDILMKNTHQQINLLEKAKIFLPKDVVIIVKPHPACPIRPADYPGLKMEVTMEPLAELLPDCDVAYSSSGTSAAVDAYCSGVPIVSMLDPKMLNLSPLRGTDGVFFASTYEELAESLISAASSTCLTNRRQDFFILNAKLPRWRKLLS